MGRQGVFFVLVILLCNRPHSSTASQGDEEQAEVQTPGPTTEHKKLNVLLLIADDLRPEISSFADEDSRPWLNSDIHTPHLDALASRSLVLKQAYVQVARCNPSRTSFLTGRRPGTTHVHNNAQAFRYTGLRHVVTLPQYFRESGYDAVGVGKVFHSRVGRSGMKDTQHSWSRPVVFNPDEQHNNPHEATWMAVAEDALEEKPLRDQLITTKALEVLEEEANNYKKNDQNFFLAVGLHKPHLPFTCPQKFYDMYPLNEISSPDNDFCPDNMADMAWSRSEELMDYPDTTQYEDDWAINSTLPRRTTLELRRGYYSCVTYVDDLFGQILDKLDSLGLREDTVVAFLGDHGWHLGENAIWGKNTNFEVATHVPAMLSIPGRTDEGMESENLVEAVDLYASLAEAAGLPAPPLCPKQNSEEVNFCTEGSSWMPLVSAPDSENWKTEVFSQYPFPDSEEVVPDAMGYSMRTRRYRYNEWVNFTTGFPTSWGQPLAVELYDMMEDPQQTVNRAEQEEYAAIVQELSNKLHKGWKGALPSND